MKIKLSTNEITHLLYNDENADWTFKGSLALAEHLEELEDDLGIEQDFDLVAIRGSYTEYETLQEIADDYPIVRLFDLDAEKEESDEIIREYVRDRGTLIEFEGGVIISEF